MDTTDAVMIGNTFIEIAETVLAKDGIPLDGTNFEAKGKNHLFSWEASASHSFASVAMEFMSNFRRSSPFCTVAKSTVCLWHREFCFYLVEDGFRDCIVTIAWQLPGLLPFPEMADHYAGLANGLTEFKWFPDRLPLKVADEAITCPIEEIATLAAQWRLALIGAH